MQTHFAVQSWSTRAIDGAPCFRAFLLLHGRALFSAHDAPLVELTAPQMFWAPFRAGGAFRLHAGGDGAWILASEDLVSRIVGDSPLSASLRSILDRSLVAPATRIENHVVELETLFDALARESSDPRPGAAAMSALYLGLVMTHLWRACAASEREARDASAPTADRFRQLIEMHYRDNLNVNEFCRMLNVTRAHLHNACTRAFGGPPQRLIHDRLVVEARLRLQQSALPIEQIAYSLGFRDPAYFNRFFRRLTGMSPGAYRKTVRVLPPKQQTSFEAWP